MAIGQNLRYSYLFGDDYPPKIAYFKGFWDVQIRHPNLALLMPSGEFTLPLSLKCLRFKLLRILLFIRWSDSEKVSEGGQAATAAQQSVAPRKQRLLCSGANKNPQPYLLLGVVYIYIPPNKHNINLSKTKNKHQKSNNNNHQKKQKQQPKTTKTKQTKHTPKKCIY